MQGREDLGGKEANAVAPLPVCLLVGYHRRKFARPQLIEQSTGNQYLGSHETGRDSEWALGLDDSVRGDAGGWPAQGEQHVRGPAALAKATTGPEGLAEDHDARASQDQLFQDTAGEKGRVHQAQMGVVPVPMAVVRAEPQ